MSDMSKYRSITEVTTGGDFNESAAVMRQLNILLNIGWHLLAIHERGWKDETTRFTTVYVLGHFQINAPKSDEIPF